MKLDIEALSAMEPLVALISTSIVSVIDATCSLHTGWGLYP